MTTINAQPNQPKPPSLEPHLEPHLKMVSVKQKKGAHHEQLACDFLLKQGLTLIAKNWLQAKIGEIDLIMLEQGKVWDTLVFVEVRARKKGANGYDYGDAISSITKGKQAKIIKTAKYFLQSHPKYNDLECRFDVIGYSLNHTNSKHYDNSRNQPDQSDPTEWIQGAFMTTAW